MKKNIDQWIETALADNPDFRLSSDFSHRVVKTIRRKEELKQIRLYVTIGVGSISMVLFGLAMVFFFLPEVFQQGFSSSTSNKIDYLVPVSVFVGVLLFIIQYLDSILVKRKMVSP